MTKAKYWAKHPNPAFLRQMEKAKRRRAAIERQAAKIRAQFGIILANKVRATSGGLTTHTHAAPVRAVATHGNGSTPSPFPVTTPESNPLDAPLNGMRNPTPAIGESRRGASGKPVGKSSLTLT